MNLKILNNMYGYTYLTTNLINGHKYVGQHQYDKPELDPNYIGSGELLLKKIKQYGRKNFKVELLEICNSKEELDSAERRGIEKYRTYIDWHEGGYNLTLGGDGVEKLCGDSKRKMIESNKKTWNTPEMKAAVSVRRKGQKASEETKKKMSIVRKGKKLGKRGPLSEEHKQKISIANSGENNYFYGKHHTDEAKKKMSIARKNRIITEETRKKLSIANSGENNGFYGKHHTDETKKKIGDTNRGRKSSEETRKKLSIVRSGKNNPMYGSEGGMKGKHHTEETKKKMSISQKGVSRQKYKYLTPIGEIKYCDKANASRWHSDWIMVE